MVFGLALLGLTRKKRFPNRHVYGNLWTYSHTFAIFRRCLCCGHHPRENNSSQVISCKHGQASYDVHSGKDPPVPPADAVEDRQWLMYFAA